MNENFYKNMKKKFNGQYVMQEFLKEKRVKTMLFHLFRGACCFFLFLFFNCEVLPWISQARIFIIKFKPLSNEKKTVQLKVSFFHEEKHVTYFQVFFR
jgi:hypothetical protein